MMHPTHQKLSPLHRMFVIEYVKDFIISRAAERVGLAKGTGSAILAREDVQEAIAQEMQSRMERTRIDADWVLTQLAQMFDADLADIFEAGSNTLLPIHQWPPIWRKMCSGVKTKEEFAYEDGMRDLVGYTKDVKILDRLRMLELIGKHTNVAAFTERLEVTTDKELTARLMAGRRRARELLNPSIIEADVTDVTPQPINFMEAVS